MLHLSYTSTCYMVGSVASFGSQIWGVNYLEITKGLNNCLEAVHMRFLQNVLGVGNKVSHDVVREEAGSPSYHLNWFISVFQNWNALRAAVGAMAHVSWKYNITLMLSGYRKCWVYEVLAFAYREGIYEGNSDRFNPDDQCPDGARQVNLGRVMGIVFPTGLVMDKLNELYLKNRWDNIQGIHTCPREAPRLGYARIRYFNWVGITGHPVCLRRTFNGHLSGSIASTAVTNLSRFRVGALQVKVNDHKCKSIARIDRVCDYCKNTV